MEKCFVIQPFDNDKFDKEFVEIFEPAIRKADFSAYRVDKDLSVRIPIYEIEKVISESAICFAEITTDNPNVWYELGYAFACGKDVVMVCSDERQGKFPFDIRHRQVILYNTSSPSDFTTLGDTITKKIQAFLKNKVIHFIRPKTDKEWLAISKLDNPQSADYQEMVKNYQLKDISCKFKTGSDYFRFGFKLIERNGNLFGDGIIKSFKDKNFLIHLGKDLNSSDVYLTTYLCGKMEDWSKSLLKFQKNEWITVKLNIDKRNKLKFYVQGELVYETMIESKMRYRLIMLAWGDNYRVELLVNDIEVKAT